MSVHKHVGLNVREAEVVEIGPAVGAEPRRSLVWGPRESWHDAKRTVSSLLRVSTLFRTLRDQSVAGVEGNALRRSQLKFIGLLGEGEESDVDFGG